MIYAFFGVGMYVAVMLNIAGCTISQQLGFSLFAAFLAFIITVIVKYG